MNISIRFYHPGYGVNRSQKDLPFAVGEAYFSEVCLKGGETHVSLQSSINCTQLPGIFASGNKEIDLPQDQVSLGWDNISKSVRVTTTHENPLKAYKIHRRYCDMFSQKTYLIAGRFVLQPKISLVAKILSWASRRLDINIVVQPVNTNKDMGATVTLQDILTQHDLTDEEKALAIGIVTGEVPPEGTSPEELKRVNDAVEEYLEKVIIK